RFARPKIVTMDDSPVAVRRRHFMASLSALGLGSTILPEALLIAAQDADLITVNILEAAQKLAGVSFTPAEQEPILSPLNAPGGLVEGFEALRRPLFSDDEVPALVFPPVLPEKALPSGPRGLVRRTPDVSRPSRDEDLAYLPVTHLARLIETR